MDPQYPQQGYNPQQPGYTPPPQGYMPQQQPAYNMSTYGYSSAEPLTMGQYIVMFLLLMIPIANIILPFVWAFGSNTNVNKKNFARALLIMMAIGIVLSVLFSSVLAGILSATLRQY